MRADRDPIVMFKNRIVSADLVNEEELKDIDKAVRAEVDEAVEYAKSSPELDLAEAYTNVYAGAPPAEIRGCDLWTVAHPKY
jgi:pyruvate dehydrogenase E1 component alpha subunit